MHSLQVTLKSLVAILAISVVTLSTVYTDANAQPPSSSVEPRLAAGDIVRITVWRKPELSGEFTIGANGAPRHPLYKEVSVVNVPISEAEKKLITFLARYEENPQVVIEPLFRVSVGGEVVSPNLFTLPRETTVLQAIALAGGPTERGRLSRVRIVRGTQVIQADLTKPTSEWANREILSGDQILVTRKRNILSEIITPFAAIVGAIAAITTVARS